MPLLVLYAVVCAVAQPGSDPVRDEPALLAAAHRLLDGQFAPAVPTLDPRAYLWHGPGLIAVLAPLLGLDLPLTAIRFVDPLLLGVAVLLFHRLLRGLLPARPALAFTYAFGLYVPFFSVLPEIHKEPLAVLLVVAGMLALTRGLTSGRRAPLVGAGAAFGALAMVRLEYGWVAILLLALAAATWALRRHAATPRRLTAVAAIAVALCVPWLAFTYHRTGKALYWGTSSGLSLFWMSPTQPGETGSWHEPASVFDDPQLTAFRPLFAHVARLDPVASDIALRAAASRNVRAHPWRYARNVAANVTRLFFAWPMRPQLSATRIAANVLFNAPLLAAVVWAAAVLWRRRRVPGTLAIAAFGALGLAVHLPPSASPRMLLPLVPVLLWLVAQAFAVRDQPAVARAARKS